MLDRPILHLLLCLILAGVLPGCPGADDDDVADDDATADDDSATDDDDDSATSAFAASAVDDLEAASYASTIALEQYALLADLAGDDAVYALFSPLADGIDPGGLELPEGTCPDVSFSLGEGIVLDYAEGCTNFRGQQIEGRLVLARSDDEFGVEVTFDEYVRNGQVAFSGSSVLGLGTRAGLSFIGSGPLDVTSFSITHALDSSTPYPGSQILGPHDGPIGDLEAPSVGPTAFGDGPSVGTYGVAWITADGSSVWIIVPEGTLHHGTDAPDACRCPDGGVLAQYHEQRGHWTAITFDDQCGFELWINAAGTDQVGTFGSDELPQLRALLCDPLEG